MIATTMVIIARTTIIEITALPTVRAPIPCGPPTVGKWNVQYPLKPCEIQDKMSAIQQ